ncbi:glycoside hydrolase family 20 zincin-like fold domain-containing protein [Anaerophaga thermohalophila]|jgi:hexosaminidase|uniref:glycoside hydrolase family 20 zincin-like fold domain-containing protein n=1 Tax=Anaerophaga thermohalophila TaxID=177400 RepID=UPI0003017808|nr:glycoside hydrolase family 20 zincin-like fold domain-containing protein [Anaerophaga thermohalophila]
MCKLFVSFVLLISSVVIFGQTKPDIIPLPVEMEVNEAVFVIDENTSVRYNKTDEELQQVAGFLSQYIEDISGISLKHNKKSGKEIVFKLTDDADLPDEGYLSRRASWRRKSNLAFC